MTYFKIDKILLGWLALAAAQVVAGILVPVHAAAPPHALEWILASNFLVAAVLGVIAVRSDWVGWRLALALVAIPWAINLVNTIEGTVFLKHSGIAWRPLMLMMSVTYILVLPLWRYIFGGGEAVPPHHSPLAQKSAGSMAWRFAVSDVSYLFLYYLAGTIIFPYVRSFYATQTVPPPGTIIALQLLLRGPVFVLLCLLLVRMIGLPRWQGAIAVGLAFTILSGVAPLLMPNLYFPDYVRWVHFGEVTSSNFVFGALVGLIWGKPKSVFEPPKQMSQAA
jgi:hypothetical protein